jgi:hypothetical protein
MIRRAMDPHRGAKPCTLGIDRAKETRYPAGSFVVMPAGQPHYSLAKDGEVVYQESGYGPTGTSFLKK